MNIKKVLTATVDYFKKFNLPQARLDAEVLLANLLGMERIQLYVNYDLPLQDDELAAFREIIRNRVKGVPVAYLTGQKEFMSLEFKVNQSVLIPRPETELLVEEVIDYCNQQQLTDPNIVDIGTGSGAIAVSLAFNLPGAKLLGIDISEDALKIATENIEKYQLADRVKVVRGDLLGPLIKRGKNNVDIVVSNPPYINAREMDKLSAEVKEEPVTALAGGNDGLDFYRRIIPESKQIMKPEGLLALEIGYDQAEAVQELFDNNWPESIVKQDYAGHDRVILARFKRSFEDALSDQD